MDSLRRITAVPTGEDQKHYGSMLSADHQHLAFDDVIIIYVTL